MAASAMVPGDFQAIHTSRFRQIFEMVSSGEADMGVLPLENALAGSVHENYDLLADFDLSIVGEYYCPVELHVMCCIPAANQIAQVLSHPKALEQCSRFLEAHQSWQQLNWSDTAGAALHVKEQGDPTMAALASEEAAKAFGLSIVHRSVQNHSVNSTRFVSLTRSPLGEARPTKCSLLCTLPHKPGSLACILSAIADQGGNVTKIESRPILGKPFEYRFYIDIVVAHEGPEALEKCIEASRHLSSSCRVIGRYEAVPSAF